MRFVSSGSFAFAGFPFLRSRFRTVLLASVGVFVAGSQGVSAGDSLTEKLPAGAWATVEANNLGVVLDRFLKSDTYQAWLASPQFAKIKESNDFKKGDAGRQLLEKQLEADLPTVAKELLGSRWILAVYPPSDGQPKPPGVFLAKVDAGVLPKYRKRLDALIGLASDKVEVAKSAAGDECLILERKSYLVWTDGWLALSEDRKWAERAIECAKSAPDASIAKQAAWKLMAGEMGPDHHLQLCADLPALPKSFGERLIPPKFDNPLGSLLAQGMFELVNASPYFGTTLDFNAENFQLRFGVRGAKSAVDPARQALLPPTGETAALPLPHVAERLAGFTWYRDMANWYQQREKLLEAKLMPEFDKFEQGINMFLPGRDYGTDILPLLGKRWQFVAAKNDYSHLNGKPGLQLPAFALLIELPKPQQGADLLQVTFQSFLSIINLTSAQQSRQPWVMTSESYNDVQISFAKYLKEPKGENLPTVVNFTPASALVNDRFVISSSRMLCRQLIDSLKTGKTSELDRTSDLFFELTPAVLADALDANRSLINAKRIQEGLTAEQADGELNFTNQILRTLKPWQLGTTSHGDHYRLELKGAWK